ncbi:YibE/F family protein [Modestobacter sp. Leaf380]|uniref:YibE/F family protein n=1 Tax=Modestobacter sp. Leaf380 TaxID=1736356 RepID=UPI0006F51FD2|nr:YibE/F family protein [Modestobacter sp. Leaf380]KQS71335.1 YibE/F family protein [Modestobacter sp. Leaf380]
MPAHTHSHGPADDVPATPQVLARRRRATWLMLLVLVPIGLATVIGLIALWPSGEDTRAAQAAELYLPDGNAELVEGRVASLETYDCSTGAAAGQQLTCATAVVEVLEDPGRGDYVSVDLPAEVVAYGIATDDTVVLTVGDDGSGRANYQFQDFPRSTPIITLAVAFVLVVAAVARWRGIAAIVGLVVSFVVLLQFVLPGILGESSPVLVTLVGSSAIMFVVLYLAHGFSARTTTALIGTLFGLILVAVLGAVAVGAARLTGLSGEETIQLSTFDPTLDFSGLVLAGITVAGLGVLNDVTITQASAIWQLHEVDPSLTWRQLFARGMAVGRDHIASTIYTIVFAYAGAALPLLLLFEIYDRSLWDVVTGQQVGEEVIRTFVGAIALVLAVPVTTAAGAFFAKAAGDRPAPRFLDRLAR